AAREHIHEARNLAQADDAAVRYVSNVGLAEKRQQVMLAQAEYFDVPDDDHFVVGDIEESLVHQIVDIHLVTAGEETESGIDALRCVQQSITSGILAELRQDRADLFNHPA